MVVSVITPGVCACVHLCANGSWVSQLREYLGRTAVLGSRDMVSIMGVITARRGEAEEGRSAQRLCDSNFPGTAVICLTRRTVNNLNPALNPNMVCCKRRALSHKTTRYCWRTRECRKLCLAYTVFERIEAWRTLCRNLGRLALK